MKKSFIFMCICALALMLGSCEPPKIENDLAGHQFTCDFGVATTSYNFSSYDYSGFKSFYHEKSYIIDFYYTYEGNIIKMYYDKEKTDLMAIGEYYGSYIIIDGDKETRYEKEW